MLLSVMTLCGTVMGANDFRQPLFVARGVALAARDWRVIDFGKDVGQRMIGDRWRHGSEALAYDVRL